MSNALRMPVAEWLFRMSEAQVPYQARGLAMYAVLFNVTGNTELATLSGMDLDGIADKTYNKWKKFLSDAGWVVIRAGLSGRSTTIEVAAAIEHTAVTFTDVKPRSTSKFYGKRPVKITETKQPSPVKVTVEAVKSAPEPVIFTGPRACIVLPSEVDSTLKNSSLEQSREPAQAPKIDLDEVYNKLLVACNGALDNPVNCQGLLSLVAPQMWLDQGCDLERDILPAVKAVAKKNHGKRLRTWNYFTEAVKEARDVRLKGLGPVPITSTTKLTAKGLTEDQRARVEAALGKAKTNA